LPNGPIFHRNINGVLSIASRDRPRDRNFARSKSVVDFDRGWWFSATLHVRKTSALLAKDGDSDVLIERLYVPKTPSNLKMQSYNHS
jgi:hypothetical protein